MMSTAHLRSSWLVKCFSLFLLLLNSSLAQAIKFPLFRNQHQDSSQSRETGNVVLPERQATGASDSTNSNHVPNQPHSNKLSSQWPGLSNIWDKYRVILERNMKLQRKTVQRAQAILLYKPPVGIVTVYTLINLVLSGRIFRLYGSNNRQSRIKGEHQNQETLNKIEEEHRKPKRISRRGRALSLEERDQVFDSYGVIERVRGRLCMAALTGVVQQQEQVHPQFAAERAAMFKTLYKWSQKQSQTKQHQVVDTQQEEREYQIPWIYGTALEGLKMSCPPGGSRHDYVDQLRTPLSKLWAAHSFSAGSTNWRASLKQNQGLDLVQVATSILELRATDAILRESRDALLKSTHRLARNLKYWNRRVEQAKIMPIVQQSFLHRTIEGDRMRLAYAEAAYKAEVDRLGRICYILMMEKQHGFDGRPKEMSDSILLNTLKKSEEHRNNEDNHSGQYDVHPSAPASSRKRWRSTWKMPRFSRYSIRVERGKLSIKHLEKDTYIDGTIARQALMEDEEESLRKWYEDSMTWVRSAKETLCTVLEETLEASVWASTDHFSRPVELLRGAWGLTGDTKQNPFDSQESAHLAELTFNNTERAWRRGLALVEDIREMRRVGEGKSVGFRDLSVVGWLGAFDFFGVPSALLKIYFAHLFHAYAAPFWPSARNVAKETWETMVTVFLTRLWGPGKDFVLDVLNRDSSSMLDDFNLKNEEHSLDIMLKDLSLGDGTPENRGKALEAATRAYEKDLRQGLMRHVASGHLVRLLLVQVQQLKVGLLNAIGDIDVLIQSNKVNVRALAFIPAVVIVVFGARAFMRRLYNFRARDIRPVSLVHEKMVEDLSRMKLIVLLSGMSTNSKESNRLSLGFKELGEFSLRMHSYLALLDICSPQPFPKWKCDDIHLLLRETTGCLTQQESDQDVKKPIAMLDMILEKHENLRKYL